MSEYKVQINVKVGDHLINIQGDTVAEAQEYLHQLAENSGAIHAAMETLDGRPATEIVQKEKTWGARSQSGRTYPRAQQTNSSVSTSAPATTPPANQSPEELLKNELGATVVSTSTSAPSAPSTPHVPDSNPELCAQHGLKRKFYEGGKNQSTGNKFSASWRCPATGCKPLWQKPDGSFQ